jgi:hypothetical protein
VTHSRPPTPIRVAPEDVAGADEPVADARAGRAEVEVDLFAVFQRHVKDAHVVVVVPGPTPANAIEILAPARSIASVAARRASFA